MKKVVDIVAELAQPVVEKHGCELWDVEFVKEAGQWFLRVYIDRDGGVDIEHCEAISRELDVVLDDADPIETSYVFEVSSAGADRPLKREKDFVRYMGSKVDVRLYMAKDGRKEYSGVLRGYDNGDVTIEMGGSSMQFKKNEIALVRLGIEF